MNLKPGEIKSFEATRKIPLMASCGLGAFLPAGEVVKVERLESRQFLHVKSPSGFYLMDEKYLPLLKEIKQ